MKDELAVHLHSKPAGTLRRTESGLTFDYSENAQQQISLSMPVSETLYTNLACEAYFGGLLPENIESRTQIARKLNANAADTFSLLRVIGHECAGAISLTEEDAKVPVDNFNPDGKELTEAELAEAIKTLPRSPLFIDAGARLSLAGYQGKAAITLIEGKICIPENGSLSTHILKPNIQDKEGIGRNSVQNEFICLRIARNLGLPVASAEIGKAIDQLYLLVERYDRMRTDNGITRVHQEDFCQALGFPSTNKYEADYGPSFENCAFLISKLTRPAKEKLTFLRYVIFNYLTGNADAHAKNYSVLHVANNNFILAPLYDTVATMAFPDLNNKMAMKIGESYDFLSVTRQDWLDLSLDLAVSFQLLRKEVLAQARKIPAIAEKEILRLGATEHNVSFQNMSDAINKICLHAERTIQLDG